MLLPFELPQTDPLFSVFNELFVKHFKSISTDENKSENKVIPSEQISNKLKESLQGHIIFQTMGTIKEITSITLGYGNRNSGSVFQPVQPIQDVPENSVLGRLVFNFGNMENYQLFYFSGKDKGIMPPPTDCKTMSCGSVLVLKDDIASSQGIRISKSKQQNYLLNRQIYNKIRPRNYQRKTMIVDFYFEPTSTEVLDKAHEELVSKLGDLKTKFSN